MTAPATSFAHAVKSAVDSMSFNLSGMVGFQWFRVRRLQTAEKTKATRAASLLSSLFDFVDDTIKSQEGQPA